jgi:HEAT repeat protein
MRVKKLSIGLAFVLALGIACVEKGKTEIQKLAEKLKDQDWNARFYSVQALGKIGGKNAVQPLLEALKDEDVCIQAYAARALGTIGDPAAIRPLIESIKVEGSIDYGAVDQALIKIGKSAVEPLIEGLKDTNWRVQSTAIRVLGEIGSRSAVEPLIQVLGNKVTSPGAPYDTTFFLRYNAAEALGKIGDKRALQPLIEALTDDDARERDEKPWVRCAAAEALGKLGDPRAIEPLIEVMKKDRGGGIRYWSADALVRIGKPAVEPLIGLLKVKDDGLRYWTTWALGQIEDQKASESLKSLREDKDKWVRTAAEAAIKGIPDQRYRLFEDDDLAAWGTDGTYKILRNTPVPEKNEEQIFIEAAGNEFEPFQVVLKAKKDIRQIEIKAPDLKNDEGQVLSRGNIEVLREEYVPVREASDILGKTGLWPDPLLPYKGAFGLKTDEEQPLWINVYIPPNTAPGDYKGDLLVLVNSKKEIKIKLRVHVFNFSLPKETHTRTAYGVGLNPNWHGLNKLEEKKKTYDLYMQVLAKHRVSPYDPMVYYPIQEKRTDKEGRTKIKLDFELFDQGAKRYLDEFGFNSFQFPLDFPFKFSLKSVVDERERQNLSEDDIRNFTEVFRQKTEHMKQNGWLSKAYCYWIDEPPIGIFPTVKAGMRFLKDNCPELKRLLTLHLVDAPNSEFYDFVNLWVPELDRLDAARIKERQQQGEEIWSYICLAPKAPYPNIFIDHPAITHRIRFWMMEKFNIQGDLIWSTTYWQHLSRYEEPADGLWAWSHSNGDGILLYPPMKQPPRKPLIMPPVTSIRFELTREGLEDREYFWVLRREIGRIMKLSKPGLDKIVKEAESLLLLPDELVKDFTIYDMDQSKIYGARTKLARMIETLSKIN